MITEQEEKDFEKFIEELKVHGFVQSKENEDVFRKDFDSQFHIEVMTDDGWCTVMDAEIYESNNLIAYMKYVDSFDDLARFANAVGFSLNVETTNPCE